MPIVLDHAIVPAHDKVASANWFADIFGLTFEKTQGHFAPVQVNDTLTLDFDNSGSFESHHYAFHVNDEEFDAIWGRVKAAGTPYGSGPYPRTTARSTTCLAGEAFTSRTPTATCWSL